MSITIENNLKAAEDKCEEVHYLPCEVEGDGEANVKDYFVPYIKKREDGTLTASFRGHPLIGSEFPGLSLRLVCEARRPLDTEAPRSLKVARNLGPVTWWGWDQQPGRNTPLHAAGQWMRIAEALHEPIEMKD